MRRIFNFLLLLPTILTVAGCSSEEKISYQSGDHFFETYYDDAYFIDTGTDYCESIALASQAMAFATFVESKDPVDRTGHLRELWSKEKFTNIWFNEAMGKEPEIDSIGFGIASKNIADFTLIAVTIRGGDYGAELVSDFTLGEEGNAKGFDEASDKVVLGLTSYLQNNGIDGHIKIWASGFSRGAIAANMACGKILNRYRENAFLTEDVTYRQEDIIAYCFEPPLGVAVSVSEARGDLYKGIHNIMNFNSIVPLLAPSDWGFTRYGTDHYFPDRLTDIAYDETERRKLISTYQFTYGAETFPKYTIDDWRFFDAGEELANANGLPRESLHPSLGRFSQILAREIANSGYISRKYYISYAEFAIWDLAKALTGVYPEIERVDPSSLLKTIFGYRFIKTLINAILQTSQTFAYDAKLLFLEMFKANDQNVDLIKHIHSLNLFSLTMFLLTFTVRKDIAMQLMCLENASSLFLGHRKELHYAFLRACDTRVTGKDACKLNDGNYYVLRIDNPSSFLLREDSLGKDVFKYKDGAMESDRIAAEKYADGHIELYLPKNGHYSYQGVADQISLYNYDPLLKESLIDQQMPLDGRF